MDIIATKELLQELSDIGINECVIEPVDEGTRVRGSNKDRNTIVFKTLEMELVETPIGIQSVRGLLSRINLFESDKAKITTKDNGDHTQAVTIKQGRRSATFRCAAPENLAVPKVVPDCGITDENRIIFNADYVGFINDAVSAMSYTGNNAERSISAKVENNEIVVTINDGEDDSFVDTKAMDVVNCRGVWEIGPFSKLMKLSSHYVDGDAEFSISEHGVAVFRIGVLDALVPPMVS